MSVTEIWGNTVGMGLPKPNMMQSDPARGDYVFGKADFLNQLPVTVSDDGYTEITGLRQIESINVVRVGQEISVTTTMQGDVTYTDTITLDDNGRPVSINANGTDIPLTWEGFDE